MRQLIREPLVHFLLLGGLIFALFALFGNRPAPAPGNRLEITANDAASLSRQFAATWHRPPTEQELDALIDALIREEVLVREALALGLDQGDAVIRQRLAQKMQFLTESGAEAVIADDATLQAHLDANAAIFARPALIGLEQIPLGDAADAGAALAALAAGADPATVGVRSLLPVALPLSPPMVVDGTFGTGFFDAVAALQAEDWAGPVDSAYGPHLVRVTGQLPERVPPLDDIRDAVEADWRAALRAELAEQRLATLMGDYQIIRPDPAAVLAR